MPDQDAIDAARSVLSRVFGGSANSFELRFSFAEAQNDAFYIEASSGRVSIVGNSAVAICRGAYHYARNYCSRMLSWSARLPISLPNPVPDCQPTYVRSAAEHRHYLSVCTYGYSMPWWAWDRWEQELDWMAMHGINMPLLLVGTETIVKRVLLSLGLTEEDFNDYFSGPAYLCWHRLGNLNGHMGPLSDSWLEGQEGLQRRILARARELGMKPIVQGFSGFVPDSIRRLYPEVQLFSAEAWAGFEPTFYLDPRSALFHQIGQRYVEEYHRAYGPVHHYLCEMFAEQVPCLSPTTELQDLREIGRAIWETHNGADPNAHWVMQGWPFYFAPDYWKSEKAAALLDAVPPGRAFVLDLATEEVETWRKQPAMREKGWMFNVVHNYGQNTHLHGDLQGFIDRASSMLGDQRKGRWQGMGISPEGIDQNHVVYELLTDLMWGETAQLDQWLTDYAQARYGARGAEEAWLLLGKIIYGAEKTPSLRYAWRFRPGDQPLVGSQDPDELKAALDALVRAGLWESDNYHRDVVDLAKTWLGAIADRYLEQALQPRADEARRHFFEVLEYLDDLLSTRPEHCLSTWLQAAREKADGKDGYEENARSLITWWGGQFLFDYAVREWSGLISDFHLPRWKLWFDWIDGASHEPDFGRWERDWSKSKTVSVDKESRSEREVIEAIMAKFGDKSFPDEEPVKVRTLDPVKAEDGAIEIGFDQPKLLKGFACVPVFGQGIQARYLSSALTTEGNWQTLRNPANVEECFRGTRIAFLPQLIQAIRIEVDVLQGNPDQLFKVLLFETCVD